METPNLSCHNCGEPFYRKPSYAKRFDKMYCCRGCYSAALKSGLSKHNMPQRPKTGQTLNCVICDKEFYRSAFWINRGVNKTCGSHECKSAYFSGARNSYWGKIRSPKTIAKIAFGEVPRHRRIFTPSQRRNWKDTECKWCGAKTRLTLDHIIPVMDGGLNVKTNAQTLCQPCNLWKCKFVDLPRLVARVLSDPSVPMRQSSTGNSQDH